jgi:hypothetical protein
MSNLDRREILQGMLGAGAALPFGGLPVYAQSRGAPELRILVSP